MARRFTTGFETGAVNEHNGAYTDFFMDGGVSSTIARTGTYSWNAKGGANTGAYAYFSQVFTDDPDELYLRYAFKFVGVAGGGTSDPEHMWALYDSGGTCHLALGLNSIDFIPVLQRNGTGGMAQTGAVAMATATKNLTSDRWYIFEVQAKIDGTAGTVVVKLNNTTILSYTGDTAASAEETIRSLRFGAQGVGAVGINDWYFDDIAVNDTTGSYQNTWPGLGGVYLLRPNGDGATTEWTTSTGTVHYTLVDDVPANTTDWVQAVTSGKLDLFDVEDSPTYVNTINLVEVLYQAAVTESGYNEVMSVIRQGTVNYTDGTSTVVDIVPSYEMYKGTPYYRQLSDGTSLWGTADINALQVGVQIL